MMRLLYSLPFAMLIALTDACTAPRHATTEAAQEAVTATKRQIMRDSNFEVEVSCQPVFSTSGQQANSAGAKSTELVFRIRVFNLRGGQSPLRVICSNLDEYNVVNEYLLNRAMRDIVLHTPSGDKLPDSYVFENGYNAVSFETLRVSFLIDAPLVASKSLPVQLVVFDRLFLRDTLRFSFTPSLQQKKSRV